MPYYQSTYHSKIYRDFKEIEQTAYRQIIYFYEQKEDAIQRLDLEESFEMLTAYVDALFETGAYQKHLLMVDLVIERTIVHHDAIRHGDKLFKSMLFKKAASYFNILEYNRADYILRELIKIDPHNSDTVMFLKKCLRKKSPDLLNNARAASIFLFLLSAFVICIEVLFIRPFYSMHTELVESSRISLFFLGFAFWAGGHLLHRWRVEREVNEFVGRVRQQKGPG